MKNEMHNDLLCARTEAKEAIENIRGGDLLEAETRLEYCIYWLDKYVPENAEPKPI